MVSLAGTLDDREGLAPTSAANPRLGIPRLYSAGVVRQIVFQVLMIVALIELIFLTEKLTIILRAAIDHNVSGGNIGLLLFYTAPRIFDLALPLALMIGVYRVISRCREDREFLVLAGMGIGLYQFIGIALGIGATAMLVSMTVSGSIDPLSRFAYRAVLFDAQHQALRGGITPGQFYFFDKYTVFAGEHTVERPERGVFVHQDHGENQRVIVAARARLTEPDAEGHMTLRLSDIIAQDFRLNTPASKSSAASAAKSADCDGCEEPFTSTPVASMRIGNFARDFNIDQLVRFEPRGSKAEEWTLPELAGLMTGPKAYADEHVRELGHRFARALLCLLAPLIAGITLAMTTRATQAFVLPAACAAVMCIDLASSRLADVLVGGGAIGMLTALIAAATAIGLLLVRQAGALQNAIIKPALARA